MLTNNEGTLLAYIQNVGPSSSYELTKRLSDTPFKVFTGSSVYPVLRRLATQELVCGEANPGFNKEKMVWHLTDKGLAELMSWGVKPLSEPEYRNERSLFKLKCVFACSLQPEDRKQLLESLLFVVRSCRIRYAEHARRNGAIPGFAAVAFSALKCMDIDIELVEQLLMEFCSDGAV